VLSRAKKELGTRS